MGGVIRPDDLEDHHVAIEVRLWVLVVVTLVIDVWLTYEGLRLGFSEGNPIVAYGIERLGFGVLGVAKAGALGVGCVTRILRPAYGPVIALGLALPWLVAVVVNTVQIAPVVIA